MATCPFGAIVLLIPAGNYYLCLLTFLQYLNNVKLELEFWTDQIPSDSKNVSANVLELSRSNAKPPTISY